MLEHGPDVRTERHGVDRVAGAEHLEADLVLGRALVDERPHVELAVLEIAPQHLRATRTGLGDDVFDGLLGRFCTETDTLLSDLVCGPAAPEAAKALADRCHRTAGSAAVFGLNRLRNALLQMETALMTGETPDLGDLVARLAAAWDDSRTALHPEPPGM